MRPSETLIIAWREYLDSTAKAKGLKIKSDLMFKHAQHDRALYHRATELHQEVLRLSSHASVTFRKALKAEWCKRYYIEWKDATTCEVWVHEKYGKESLPLNFNKSLRCRKCLR